MTQEKAIEMALSGENIFLTGNAGTGKTYTLNKIIEHLERMGKVVAKTASTGIASTHINGKTIHSWAKIGIKEKLTTDDLYAIKNNKWSRKQIQATDVLVIDEISMLHDYRLDMIEEICRFVKNPSETFGGIQVILSGDFFQLPPVNKDKKTKNYCFNAQCWNDANFFTAYLKHIYRQTDPVFVDILNSIRNNSITDIHKNILDELKHNTDNIETGINLYCTNRDVDKENAEQLSKINGKSYYSQMTGDGNDFSVQALKGNCLADEWLTLKVGAKVMLLVNDTMGKYVNGSIGIVTDLSAMDLGVIKILLSKTNQEITIGKYTWKMEEYNEREGRNMAIATITQFPVKLAWALTIHKSQGATFDFVNLFLKNVFVENMGYVALSRITSLMGLFLDGYNEIALMIDDIILKKDKDFQAESELNSEGIDNVRTAILPEKCF